MRQWRPPLPHAAITDFPLLKTRLTPRLGVLRALARSQRRPAIPAPLGSRRFRTLPVAVCASLALSLAINGAAQTTLPTVVTETTESALRLAVGNGGWIVFAHDGTFALSGTINVATNTVLDATGHSVTLSGGGVPGCGSVLSVSSQAALTLSNLTIQNGWATFGGGVSNNGTLNVVGCVFSENTAGGLVGELWTGEPGGDAGGGAICNYGRLNVSACTFLNNRAVGGAGGLGSHGAVQSGPNDPILPVSAYNGGPGGNGGNGNGGAIYNAGTAAIVNCTIAANSGSGGVGGPGGDPGAYSVLDPNTGQEQTFLGLPGTAGASGTAVGAICGNCALTNCTLVVNLATGGPTLAGPTLVNTLLAANTPGDAFADAGYNLVSSQTQGVVGTLQNNGGLTPTMALPAGSPAIGAGSRASAPPTDQRGFPRPVGLAVDIGAYQYLPCPLLAVSPSPQGVLGLRIYGSESGSAVCLLTSPDLSYWTALSTNQIGANGIINLPPVVTGDARRYFRLAAP